MPGPTLGYELDTHERMAGFAVDASDLTQDSQLLPRQGLRAPPPSDPGQKFLIAANNGDNHQFWRLEGGLAEYGVNSTDDGVNNLFLLYYIRGADGVWRLDEF